MSQDSQEKTLNRLEAVLTRLCGALSTELNARVDYNALLPILINDLRGPPPSQPRDEGQDDLVRRVMGAIDTAVSRTVEPHERARVGDRVRSLVAVELATPSEVSPAGRETTMAPTLIERIQNMFAMTDEAARQTRDEAITEIRRLRGMIMAKPDTRDAGGGKESPGPELIRGMTELRDKCREIRRLANAKMDAQIHQLAHDCVKMIDAQSPSPSASPPQAEKHVPDSTKCPGCGLLVFFEEIESSPPESPKEPVVMKSAPGSPDRHNEDYLGLRQNEYQMHKGLMEMGARYWPESLQEYMKSTSDVIGMCGDVAACAVADWIKGKRAPYVLPTSAPTSPPPATTEAECKPWSFCPECGSPKLATIHSTEKSHRQCSDCGQEWFTDIDYRDTVATNLRTLTAQLVAAREEVAKVSKDRDDWQKDSNMFSNAWNRELGPRRKKTHLIDELVVGTKDLRTDAEKWREHLVQQAKLDHAKKLAADIESLNPSPTGGAK